MKILVAFLGVCFVQTILASSALPESNSIDKTEEKSPTDSDYKPVQNVVAAVYQRAMLQALQAKVTELHKKLSTGENAVPAAMDILKITLLSHPAQEAVRRAAEHIINAMAPELKKFTNDENYPIESRTTTPNPSNKQ
ncbi:CLUMA_CG019629, isoform A [Clunio marinus]|uniref:CLUMA_CG019629, isoform A n=1 Tax=Clunio marinus TaxID=568069 RepID=A0A1J1J4R1_9DIPT|nr:CLUMA_CG019629, isoform A [Clunio marinus]